MPVLLWDASALAKRYVPEQGSDMVDALFENVALSQMVGTLFGYAEAFSVVLRKHNRGEINANTFQKAKTLMRSELFDDREFHLLSLYDEDFVASQGLMEKHNINSADAAILAAFLRYTRRHPKDRPVLVLVAADKDLLRAAEREGIGTLDPESLLPENVPSRLEDYARLESEDDSSASGTMQLSLRYCSGQVRVLRDFASASTSPRVKGRGRYWRLAARGIWSAWCGEAGSSLLP